ncbi:MAG: carboxypeptidase-like regulatory domain-containing protein [Acidobacteriota bacterium]|nr:carboxypeptidase-like regulatory domain-containing protein [Acidobacteriota bacterium]
MFFTTNFSAQQNKGKIHGIITDEYGAAAPGADITITEKTTESRAGIRTVESDSEGKFTLENVTSGAYKISVEFMGGMSYESESVSVVDGQTTKLEIQVCYGGCVEKDSVVKPIEITDTDKAEIVNQVLENALVKKNLPDYNLLIKQKGRIVLSTENIKLEWLKLPPNINLKLMTKKQIQSRADNTKDFLYLSFAEFKQAKRGIVVKLTNSWAVGKNSGMAYLSGGGNIFLYRKESDKWIGKSLGGWIS